MPPRKKHPGRRTDAQGRPLPPRHMGKPGGHPDDIKRMAEVKRQVEAAQNAPPAQNVHTSPPGPASAGGSTVSPAPGVQHGRGRYLIPIAVGAGVLGAGAYLASRRRKKEPVGKQWIMPDGEVVTVSKSTELAPSGRLVRVAKADMPITGVRSVSPRTASGPYVGHANDLKVIRGHGTRQPRTKLLVLHRGSGRGKRIAKSDEGWNTFGGGREVTPAISRNGLWAS